MTTPPAPVQSSRAGGRGKDLSPKSVVLVLLLAVVVIGGAAAIAFYGEEIATYTSLRGWDRGTPARLVAEFVRNAHSERGRDAAAAMEPNLYEPVYNGNRLTHVKWAAPSGPATTPVTQWAPVGETKSVDAELRHRAGSGYFRVVVEFANGKWGVFRVVRAGDGLRIVEFPQYLGNERPLVTVGD